VKSRERNKRVRNAPRRREGKVILARCSDCLFDRSNRASRDERFRARNESGERIVTSSIILLRHESVIPACPVPPPPLPRPGERDTRPPFHSALRITGVRIPRRFPGPPFQASLLCTARNSANDLTHPRRPLLPSALSLLASKGVLVRPA